MKVWRLGSFSDFGGVVKPQASYVVNGKGSKNSYRAGGYAAFCLPDSFCGKVSFCGNDLFAMSVSFDDIGNAGIGSFGLRWDDVCKAFEAAGFVETDEEPMVESAWFDALCDDFASWTLSKLAF